LPLWTPAAQMLGCPRNRGNFRVIRWALDRIAYALGVILFSAAVVSGLFASAGLVAAVAMWVMSNINLAAR
jgi:hypothetical protein